MDNIPFEIPFVKARYFKAIPDDPPRDVRLIVLHTTENFEKDGTAMAIAKYFASEMLGADGKPRIASSHVCIDAKQVVQCVRFQDVAYGAPGTNHNGIHVEHVGFAKQTTEQWADDFSISELSLSAQVVAQLCSDYWIPVEFIDFEGLLLGNSGITTHAQVTKACLEANKRKLVDSPFFNKKNPNKPLTDHFDPGPRFPMDGYIEAVRSFP